MPIERRPPLSEAQHACLEESLVDWSQIIAQLVVDGAMRPSDDVQAFWELAGDPSHPDHPLNSDDLYWRDGQVVAVGHVAE